MSEDNKTLIVILLLIFVYPVGVIMMLVWMKWPWWVKLLVCLPVGLFILFFGGIVLAAILATVNPGTQINKASEAVNRNQALEVVGAVERYYAEKGEMPWEGTAKESYSSRNIKNEAWLEKLVSAGELKASSLVKLGGPTVFRLNKPMNSEEVKVCFDSTAVESEEVCVPE